jgi:hypothetical protein
VRLESALVPKQAHRDGERLRIQRCEERGGRASDSRAWRALAFQCPLKRTRAGEAALTHTLPAHPPPPARLFCRTPWCRWSRSVLRILGAVFRVRQDCRHSVGLQACPRGEKGAHNMCPPFPRWQRPEECWSWRGVELQVRRCGICRQPGREEWGKKLMFPQQGRAAAYACSAS